MPSRWDPIFVTLYFNTTNRGYWQKQTLDLDGKIKDTLHRCLQHQFKLTDRYNFTALTQSPSDTIQSWEIKVRQAGSLCEYEKMTDELCRDKFIFGLHDKFTDIRTELLKSDKNSDGSVKSLSDVVQVARVLETAASANTLISKAHQEQVNYAATRNPRGPPQTSRSELSFKNPKRIPHAKLNLKREPSTCWYCGSHKSHSWQ